MRERGTTIDLYIETFPEEVRPLLEQLRQTIHELVPEASETISYAIPTFRWKGKNLVHFAGYARHIGFYPGAATMAAFSQRLEGFKISKGTVQFPLNRPLPLDLVKEMVSFRLASERETEDPTRLRRPRRQFRPSPAD